MNNDDQTYVSVKIFADITGKTTQAIYKRFKEPNMREFVELKKRDQRDQKDKHSGVGTI